MPPQYFYKGLWCLSARFKGVLLFESTLKVPSKVLLLKILFEAKTKLFVGRAFSLPELPGVPNSQ